MSGVTLVEMVVVLGLMGVAGMAVMQMMDTSNKAIKNIDTKDAIFQFTNQLNDILKNPNNCELSLGGRTNNSNVPIIYQLVNGSPIAKYMAEAIPSNPNKVSIASMTILDTDVNGGNGSTGLGTLRVAFRKPDKNQIGGKIINKDINFNANFCQKTIMADPDLLTLMGMCTTGPNRRVVEGPHTWGTTQWLVCQDCTNGLSEIIRSCQSQGGGGGVDVGGMSKLTCIQQGGVWDDNTSTCNTDDATGLASCTSLGGVYNASTDTCSIGNGGGKLQAKLCALETIVLAESMPGGTTTLCSPNVFVAGVGLVNLAHSKADCVKSGGTVYQNFCKFNGSALCPTVGNWTQYNGWRSFNGLPAYMHSCQSCSAFWIGNSCCHLTVNAYAKSPVSFMSGASQPSSFHKRCWYGGADCARSTDPRTDVGTPTAIGCF